MNNFIDVSWSALKSNMEAKKLSSKLQWVVENDCYNVYFFDGPMKLHAVIKITEPKNSDQHDFETIYKATSNLILDPIDADNSPLSRVKVTRAGWNYQLHFVEFETAKLNSLTSQDENGVELGFGSLKFYNEANQLLENPTQEQLNTDCKMTKLDWELPHDYEVVGGAIRQKTTPTEAVRLWVIGVPAIPKNYGGNKTFVQGGGNLEFFPNGGEVKADGKAPKMLFFKSGMHTNQLRLSVRTASKGFKHKILMVFEIFVP